MAGKKATKSKNAYATVWGIFTGLLAAIVTLAILIILDGRHTEIKMLGRERVQLEFGQSWEDPGVEVRVVGNLFHGADERQVFYAVEDYDANRVGTQTLHYIIAAEGEEFHLSREITVIDTQKPVITLLPIELGYEPSWMNGYIEPGFTAVDNVDGDMSGMVEVTRLEDSVVYRVTDSSGNEAVAERQIGDWMAPPTIELYGGAYLAVPTSMSWEDPGFRATDPEGRDLSDLVTVEGSVTPYHSGEYEIVYTLTNVFGESVSVTREIHVEPVTQSDTVYPDRKTIYLTFDDGPGPYTDWLLDILAQYNVKATFFITGNQPAFADCIGRAYREGHTIGVHSYTHNYWNIYASEEAYFDDFNRCEDLIYEQTGSYTKIFRFPGGSSNTVSSFNPGIMSRLVSTMTDMGYYYFDWNVTSGDAGETTDTEQVFYNVRNGCGSDVNVVLQHDIKGFSVAAVERIIIWGLNNGYQFLPLEESSYGAHHGINN